MENELWERVQKEVTEILDSIDILWHLDIGVRQELGDFMDYLEEKYPYTIKDARKVYIESLFDGFSKEDFYDYLVRRYGHGEIYLQEYTKIDIYRRK